MAAEVAVNEERIYYLSRAKLIDLLGPDAAQRLVAAIGGVRFSVPAPGSLRCAVLASTIGAAAADKFCREYGSLRVETPRFLRSMLAQRIVEMSQDGISVPAIARALGCSERRVRQVRAQNNFPL